MGSNVVALQHVEQTVRPPAQPVQGVVGVFCTKPGEQDFLAIGFAIAIGVRQMNQLLGMGNIGAADAIREDSARNNQLVIKN